MPTGGRLTPCSEYRGRRYWSSPRTQMTKFLESVAPFTAPQQSGAPPSLWLSSLMEEELGAAPWV